MFISLKINLSLTYKKFKILISSIITMILVVSINILYF